MAHVRSQHQNACDHSRDRGLAARPLPRPAAGQDIERWPSRKVGFADLSDSGRRDGERRSRTGPSCR